MQLDGFGDLKIGMIRCWNSSDALSSAAETVATQSDRSVRHRASRVGIVRYHRVMEQVLNAKLIEPAADMHILCNRNAPCK